MSNSDNIGEDPTRGMEQKSSKSKVAELSVLYEIANLSFEGSLEDFAEEARKKARRLFSIRGFALLEDISEERTCIACERFWDDEEIKKKIEANKDNQFLYQLGKDEKLGVLFMEQSDPIDDSERRLYTIFGKQVEDGFAIAKNIRDKMKAKEREEFLHSLLRHDVGNKTQVAGNYLELIKDHDLPEEAEELVDRAEGVVEDSIEIIKKVRKLKTIEEETINKIDLNPILDKVLSKYNHQLRNEGIKVEKQSVDCRVKAGSLLEEMFSNLIENSIKHSNCSKIRITNDVFEGDCIISFEDDGVGIDEDIEEKIFEKGFKKGKKSGSGLGMYLIKEIIEAYGGHIEIGDSKHCGLKFDIYLKKVDDI